MRPRNAAISSAPAKLRAPAKTIRFRNRLPSVTEQRPGCRMGSSVTAKQIDRGAPNQPDTATEEADRENAGHPAIGTGNVRIESDIGCQPSGAGGADASDPGENCAKPACHSRNSRKTEFDLCALLQLVR